MICLIPRFFLVSNQQCTCHGLVLRGPRHPCFSSNQWAGALSVGWSSLSPFVSFYEWSRARRELPPPRQLLFFSRPMLMVLVERTLRVFFSQFHASLFSPSARFSGLGRLIHRLILLTTESSSTPPTMLLIFCFRIFFP